MKTILCPVIEGGEKTDTIKISILIAIGPIFILKIQIYKIQDA